LRLGARGGGRTASRASPRRVFKERRLPRRISSILLRWAESHASFWARSTSSSRPGTVRPWRSHKLSHEMEFADLSRPRRIRTGLKLFRVHESQSLVGQTALFGLSCDPMPQRDARLQPMR